MSFFPRSFISEPATSFTPLFRLLEDYENFNSGNTKHHHRNGVMKTFSPKFDVKEVSDAYELHGELPGIEQNNVQIEFTDAQTLTVKGRTERSFTSGTPPAGLVESSKTAGAITENSESKDHGHRATVEDEDAPEKSSTEVTKAEPKDTEPKAKYWVSERSVGEFSRSFSFPVRVDQDAVHASMKNGILSIVVPKAKKLETRKITIN
jgi:HSP20 family molecular chaperone IbpA